MNSINVRIADGPPATKALQVHIRWMIRKDMPEVLDIENHSFQFPWDEENFIRALRQRNCIGMVGEADKRVVSFMIYELHQSRLHLLNFAVHEDYRFKGVGRQMVQKLAGKLCRKRRNRVVVDVRESNLDAHLFFKACGFEAVDVVKKMYEETQEDAYHFVLRYRA